MEALLFEPFFTSRMKMLGRPNGFKLYGKLRVNLSSLSESPHLHLENRLRLIRARTNFNMVSDNPNGSLGNVGCSLDTRGFTLKDDYDRNKWIC